MKVKHELTVIIYSKDGDGSEGYGSRVIHPAFFRQIIGQKYDPPHIVARNSHKTSYCAGTQLLGSAQEREIDRLQKNF